MAWKVASLSLRRREPLGPTEEARKWDQNRGSRWRDGQLLRCDTVARTGAKRRRGPTRPLGLSNRAGFYPVKPPAHQGQGMGEVPPCWPLGPSWSAPPTAREVLAGSRKDLQELMYVQAAWRLGCRCICSTGGPAGLRVITPQQGLARTDSWICSMHGTAGCTSQPRCVLCAQTPGNVSIRTQILGGRLQPQQKRTTHLYLAHMMATHCALVGVNMTSGPYAESRDSFIVHTV